MATWLTFDDVSVAIAGTDHAISIYASGIRGGRGSLARVAFSVAHMPAVLQNLLGRFDADDEDLREFGVMREQYLEYLRTRVGRGPSGSWHQIIDSYVAKQRIRLIIFDSQILRSSQQFLQAGRSKSFKTP